MKQIIEEMLQGSFDYYKEINVQEMSFLGEMRSMCEVNRCGQYGTTWSCPPGVGSFLELKKLCESYQSAIVVAKVTKMEDDFDLEGFDEARKVMNLQLQKVQSNLTNHQISCLVLGVGRCERCTICTYPDQPCRFPREMMISIEATGMDVSKLAKGSGIPYYHGPKTVTYFGCILMNKRILC